MAGSFHHPPTHTHTPYGIPENLNILFSVLLLFKIDVFSQVAKNADYFFSEKCERREGGKNWWWCPPAFVVMSASCIVHACVHHCVCCPFNVTWLELLGAEGRKMWNVSGWFFAVDKRQGPDSQRCALMSWSKWSCWIRNMVKIV